MINFYSTQQETLRTLEPDFGTRISGIVYITGVRCDFIMVTKATINQSKLMPGTVENNPKYPSTKGWCPVTLKFLEWQTN